MKIKCPACDFENEEGARFCSNCNTPLVKPKTSNATENPYIKIKNENINTKQIKNKLKLKINKRISKKIILGIIVPVIAFFIFFTIAYYVGADTRIIESRDISRFSRTIAYVRTYYRPFDWQKTWPIWIVYLMFSCVFEYILFKDKEIYINKLGLILKKIFRI